MKFHGLSRTMQELYCPFQICDLKKRFSPFYIARFTTSRNISKLILHCQLTKMRKVNIVRNGARREDWSTPFPAMVARFVHHFLRHFFSPQGKLSGCNHLGEMQSSDRTLPYLPRAAGSALRYSRFTFRDVPKNK